MGKLKRRRRVKGTLIFLILIGFLSAGFFVNHYFQGKAAAEPANQPNNENIKEVDPEELAKNIEDYKLEKELIRKQQEKVVVWKNEQEKKEVVESAPTDTASTQPADNGTAAPSTTPTGGMPEPEQSQQPTPQPGGNKTVYLTFDDGPGPFSGDIIALLEQYQFKATFFMLDGNIRNYPDAVKLMVSTGQAVGLHSVTHDKNKFYASAGSVISELTQNRNTLKEISGVDSYLMRTPYGSVPHMKPDYRKAVDDNGYLMWDWNIDSKDWSYKDARYVNSVIEQLNRLANHDGPLVILLHERKETLAHLPKLFDYLSKQGYEAKPLDSSMVPYHFK